MKKPCTYEDISYCVNAASRYSPWNAATAASGYLTAPGGHRIGLCGECVIKDNSIAGIRTVTALCIRVARDFPGIAQHIEPRFGSVLIIGSPGTGKTTLLRDLIRKCSQAGQGGVAVADERGELFPANAFQTGDNTDILTGCSKAEGVSMLLRTMGPGWIAVDEITRDEDCHAMLQAGRCGVKFLATAHAASREDLTQRPIYRKLLEMRIFDQLVILQQDKTYRVERMGICT